MTSLEAASKQSQILVQDVQTRHGGKVFYDLRKNLNLTAMTGSPELVGLHTLLDGAQIEYRAMVSYFHQYLTTLARNNGNDQKHWESQYPDLFLKYSFRELDWQSLVDLQVVAKIQSVDASPGQVKHSLANLGRTSGTKYIVETVVELANMLFSPDLLEKFPATVDSVSQVQQTDQDMELADQSPAATGQAPPMDHRAFMHWFWLNVIGGGNADQLRYYLCNMLTFSIIPRIVGQVLESDKPGKALELAEQLGQIGGIKRFVKDYDVDAPNYFEFIMLYATQRELKGLEHKASFIIFEGEDTSDLYLPSKNDFEYECFLSNGDENSESDEFWVNNSDDENFDFNGGW
ncbi:hypothetical protein H4R35_001528 [Dimargaris xerosporica]|nr:hypothetical protein H4R35_001528 [Dimargaris xerosporica]